VLIRAEDDFNKDLAFHLNAAVVLEINCFPVKYWRPPRKPSAEPKALLSILDSLMKYKKATKQQLIRKTTTNRCRKESQDLAIGKCPQKKTASNEDGRIKAQQKHNFEITRKMMKLPRLKLPKKRKNRKSSKKLQRESKRN